MSLESNKVSTNTGSSEGNGKKTSKGKGTSGAGGGATEARACAACKYQRRRCVPDCPLAPYFPAENQQQFLNAHKLFGLRNLSKVVKNMKLPQRDIAIQSMIFQANMRASDPVGGCLRLVQELRKQIDLHKAELDLVLEQLNSYRAQSLENEIQKFNTPTGANTAVADGEENGNGCFDDVINFYNSIHVPPAYDYNGHHDDAFDDIPDRSEDVKPLVDGSSSENVVVPKVEAEADQTHAPQETDLKNAASQFSLRN